ncbi:MAG: DNA polymerase III subunit gamma/tau [Gammaproteobacteria bacterium]
MSYQVLARKWRPRSFTEMVGQAHVLRALINALDNDRLHHAFLFTGTRGVGKTTIARILAKSLNCEQGVSSRPCGECAACREIDEGRFVDLIEVDAASRTKVEDTRELLENVQYAPTRGRYKVYLIDEVHMLSKHSFNALLKTLEEPPPHIKFLLATTDPQRLPVTILSRCLQFNLKRLPLQQIRDHLAQVLEQEGIVAEGTALSLIARAADGSMRDALSLLDQAIAYGGGDLQETEVRAMLGSIDQSFVVELLEALAGGDGAALLATVARAAAHSFDFGELLDGLISTLQRVALAQLVPDAVDDEEGDREQILSLAQRLAREDVQLYYQIAVMGRRDLPHVPDARGGFEMILLRMLAFRPAPPTTAVVGGGGMVTDRPVAASRPPAAASTPAAAPSPVPAEDRGKDSRSRQGGSASPSVPPAAAAAGTGSEWGQILEALQLTGLLREMASHCVLTARDPQHLCLVLDAAHAHLLSRQREQQLEQALQRHFGAELKLEISAATPTEETPAARQARRQGERMAAAVEAIENDNGVKALQETFNARIIPETIQPVD